MSRMRRLAADDRRDVGLQVRAAQKASPAPVTIATSTESSSRKSLHVSTSSACISGSIALRASGRLIVT